MSSRPAVIVVESSDIGVGYTAEAIQRLGYEPIFFCQLEEYQGDPRAQLSRHRVVNVDTTHSHTIVAAARQLGVEIRALITTQDSRLKVASAAALELGVRGIDPVVIRLKDKAHVAELIPEFSPSTVQFELPRIPREELEALFEHGHSVIFKPTEAAGGMGAVTAADHSALAQLVERLEREHVPEHMGGNHWIAQTFIEGRLVSSEGYVIDGKPKILGFSGRHKVGNTETAAMFPVDQTLPKAARVRAESAINALISRSGFSNGYFHIEFIIGAEDCVLIDANMGRIGGGAIAEQLALSHRVGPVDVYEHLLRVILEEGLQLPSPYSRHDRRETFAIFYGLEHGGVVTGVKIPASTTCHHTQIISAGRKVAAMGANDWSWIGILSGFTRDCKKVIRHIRITTPEGEHPAYF